MEDSPAAAAVPAPRAAEAQAPAATAPAKAPAEEARHRRGEGPRREGAGQGARSEGAGQGRRREGPGQARAAQDRAAEAAAPAAIEATPVIEETPVSQDALVEETTAAEAPVAETAEHPEGEAAPTVGADGQGRRGVADSTIRVDVDLLDELMLLVGELVLTRNQIVQYVGRSRPTPTWSAPPSGST